MYKKEDLQDALKIVDALQPICPKYKALRPYLDEFAEFLSTRHAARGAYMILVNGQHGKYTTEQILQEIQKIKPGSNEPNAEELSRSLRKVDLSQSMIQTRDIVMQYGNSLLDEFVDVIHKYTSKEKQEKREKMKQASAHVLDNILATKIYKELEIIPAGEEFTSSYKRAYQPQTATPPTAPASQTTPQSEVPQKQSGLESRIDYRPMPQTAMTAEQVRKILDAPEHEGALYIIHSMIKPKDE